MVERGGLLVCGREHLLSWRARAGQGPPREADIANVRKVLVLVQHIQELRWLVIIVTADDRHRGNGLRGCLGVEIWGEGTPEAC